MWKGESGKGYYLEKLMHNCPEALEPFNGICGFSKHNPSYTNKTLFRFPLRSRKSKLSSAVYNIDKLHSLLDTLKDEAQYLLVFLRSVCSIEICKITESNDTLSLFKVSISQRDYQARLSQQRRLVEQVETTFIGQSQYSVRKVIKDTSHFNIEKVDDGICSAYEWLVVNQVGSDSDEVMNLAEKQHILPWVGTAIDLKCSFSNGRIFCVLPLPVEDQAPFCVHVNGTFVISSNRRSLKWEAQERKGDEEGIWNKLLVEKCLPSCYVKLVIELMEVLSDPSAVYNCWPDIGRVSGTQWQCLLAPFYQSLLRNNKVVHTPLFGGRWISVRDAVFITADVPQAVRDAITKCNVNVVEVNDSCNQALKQYCSSSLTMLQPALVRSYLKRNHQSYSYASRESKFEILRYCLKDNSYHDVVGLHLLPLANGSFQQFQSKSRYVEDTFVCSSSFPCNLLPGLESKLVNVYNEDDPVHSLLCSIANSSHTQLIMLNAPQVANLLSQCSTSSWSREQMSCFWQWLKDQQLSYFQNKLLVPIKSYSHNVTSITPLARQGRVIYVSQYTSVPSRDLLTGLENCGIQFADAREFSYLSHSQLSEYLYQFEHNQVLDALQSLSVANASLSSTEAIALQDFFSHSYLNSSRMATITMIPLFKVLQYDESSRRSINAIRTSHVGGNKAIAMNGSYGFRTDLLPSSPFVIDASGNVSSLLRNLTNFVVLMTETDYLLTIAFQKIHNRQFTNSSVVPFMISVLENFYSPQYRQVSQQLISAMRNLPFVEVMSDSATLNAPQNLFDFQNATLTELYLGEWHRFPASNFKPYLPILRQCGLKSAITADDIYKIIVSIWGGSCIQNSYNTDSISYARIVSVMKHLKNNPDLFIVCIENRKTLLNTLRDQSAQHCWLPLTSIPPSDYPSCLAWKGSQYSGTTLVSTSISPLVVLTEDLSSSVLPIIVGSEVLFVQNVPSQLAQGLDSQPSIMVPAVISHFNQVVSKADRIPNKVLQEVSLQTYTYLLQNINYCNVQSFSYKWIWLESLSRFVESSHVAVEVNPSFRSNLEPFIFVLPSSLQGFSELFTRCSVPATVTADQILSVLQSIKDNSSGTQITDDVAWSIVRSIIEWIAENTDRIGDHNILVPVDSEISYPQLLSIEEVSYTDNEMLRDIANDSDEEYHLIHPKLSHLASVLELTPLSDQLDITQDVFDDAGQHEPLTTRLSNILREYKDGLTIIKEMIQNADDAGATEVNILYDNRAHPTQNLLFKGMAESHGPALIVHNNSTFTNEDFENITILAGATKANQPLKIGKFGVGFCSVYHITDVPSFVSGEWLYIFDPTLKYLKGVVRNESRPGKKVKYMSKFLARSQQLTPYEDLFGFTASSNYNGTMFRLPFRASPSQISPTLYNDYLVQQMKDDLVANGSKLLLFLQHVKRITFSSIQRGSPVTEVSINLSNTENGIKTCVTKSPESLTTEYWLVSCQEEELRTKGGDYKPGTASVACQLVKEDSSYVCKAIEGNAFCFLPLSVPSTGLPVHVSANFAVMSNRSGIWTGASSGVASDSREQWNQHLMTTIIPKAYCNLLLKLQEMSILGRLALYYFCSLWPLSNSLQMKYPWESLIPALFELMSHESLFYSSSSDQWLTLAQSQFLPSSLFQVAEGENYSLIEATAVLNLPVVVLPGHFLQQMQNILSSAVNIITDDEFAEKFLINIQLFNNNIIIRNSVLLIILSALGLGATIPVKYENVKNLLEKLPCIPSSPEGVVLKIASQLVDPLSFSDLFDAGDGMFPLDSFYNNTLVHEAIVRLGLMSQQISGSAVIASARTIEALYDKSKEKALKRVKAIVTCFAEKKAEVPPELNGISFLPVLPKPDGYVLPWKGEGLSLLSPDQAVCDYRGLKTLTFTVGSQRAIVNTESIGKGGCGYIPQRVLKSLGINTRPSFNDVLSQFEMLIKITQSPGILNKTEQYGTVKTICQHMYEFFEDSLDETVVSRTLSDYCNRPFIWMEKRFVSPCDVAEIWKYEHGPYLYKLPSLLSRCPELLKCLKVKKSFNFPDLIDALHRMHSDFSSHEIPKEYQVFTKGILTELNSVTVDSLDITDELILVDESYTLRPVDQLSFNDAPWLPSNSGTHFIHSALTRKQALALGVKPIRSKFLDHFCSGANQSFSGVPFGQKEKLTQRIKNVLRDYPFDVTFLKELLQNADDARANEMIVILDKRQHGKERVPSKEWGEELQGPALLVWNDRNFTDKDLEGIQRLGLGSKRDDVDSIGQFGIGFNVVYHLTDCPSFITRGNTLCVFDPHCKFAPGSNPECPGRRYDEIDDSFWQSMSDLSTCYLRAGSSPRQIPNLTSGTLFRLPLRTQALFETTELVERSAAVPLLSVDMLHDEISSWMDDMKHSLLFLNHVNGLKFYVIESDSCTCEFSCKVEMTSEDSIQRDRFLQMESKYISNSSERKPFTVMYSITVRSSNTRHSEKWMIQKGIGFEKSTKEQTWHDRIIPKHGIAVPLNHPHRLLGRVFCFLPLPVSTYLPVHVNGQFVLNSNRRSLWKGDRKDDKMAWNKSIIKAIASSYSKLLPEIRSQFISETEEYSEKDFDSRIARYYDLFPLIKFKLNDTDKTLDNEWQTLTEDVYNHLWNDNPPVLAVKELLGENFKISWHKFRSSESFRQVYFQPKKNFNEALLSVLECIEMHITCAPYKVFRALKNVCSPLSITPLSVFNFFTKHYSMMLTLPCKLEDTPFKSVQDFKLLLQYLLNEKSGEFPKSPFDQPLLLTADNYLRKFSEQKKVLVSHHHKLFSSSLDEFLHPDLIDLQLSGDYYQSSSFCNFRRIGDILTKNLPPVMKGKIAPCDVIDEEILKALWKWIDEEFSYHRDNIVKQWAILPSQFQLYSSKSSVLPIIDPDDSTNQVFPILTKLGIPVLKAPFYSTNMLEYCADLSKSKTILSIVCQLNKDNGEVFMEKVLLLDDSEISVLLRYFSLSTVFFTLDSMLLSLPFFKTVGGTLTTLRNKKVYFWPSKTLPKEGHEIWAPVDKLVFLDKSGPCQSISSSVCETLSVKEFYSKIVFPRFSQLDYNERLRHMSHIRKHVFSTNKGNTLHSSLEFHQNLKLLIFLEASSSEELQPASSFVDHTVKIFTTFRDKFQFLDEEYSKEEWLDFLRSIGLRTRVTPAEYIELCTSVSKVDSSGDVSCVLTDYLFSSEAESIHNKPKHLSKICDIAFVNTHDLNSFFWIVPPIKVGLTKLNGAVTHEYASLLWTVKPVVKIPQVPESLKKVLLHLNMITEPSIEDVYQNVINISKSPWSNFQLFDRYTPPSTDVPNISAIVNVVIDNIEYLYKQSKSSTQSTAATAELKLKELLDVPFIPVDAESHSSDIRKPVLVSPLQVVMVLQSSEEGLHPYINILPEPFGRITSALSVIGFNRSIKLKNIQHLLMRIYQQSPSGQNPNRLNLLKHAINKLYDLLWQKAKPIPADDLYPLYLPSVDSSLVLSTSLVFIDRDRYKNKSTSWDFTKSPFSLLHISSMLTSSLKKIKEKEFCELLPETIRPRYMSVLCQEEVIEVLEMERNVENKFKEHFNTLKTISSHCSKELLELFKQQDDVLSELFTDTFVGLIKNIDFVTLSSITSRVMIESVEVGRIAADYVLQRIDDDNYVLYSSESIVGIDNELLKDLARTLCLEVARIAGKDESMFFGKSQRVYKFLRVKDLQDFEAIMEEYSVTVDIGDMPDMSDDSQPNLGQPVSDYWFSFLDSDVNNIFRSQEWVAYEVSEDSFVWAIVLHQVEQITDNPLLKQYMIQIKEEDDINGIPVSILNLHKLVEGEPETFSEDVVYSEDCSEASATVTLEISKSKRKICAELILIWTLPDDKKKRALRRLYLQYHPDKADPNKVLLYEEAFKFLKQQINRLQSNLSLLDPDVIDDDDINVVLSSYWDGFYGQWDESIRKRRHRRTRRSNRRRRRREKRNKEDATRLKERESENEDSDNEALNSNQMTGFGFQPVPDKGEGKRWIRQAESDLEAMLSLYTSLNTDEKKISSQLVFMAHQVMEKSLKAAMYALLGLNPLYLTKHSLSVHARALGSYESSLLPLKDLVSGLEHHYLLSRYPNMHPMPKAPVDVYTANEAEDYAHRAQSVYNHIIGFFK